MNTRIPTQAKLKELFHYDPDAGDFIRKTDINTKARIGDIAGYVNENISGKRYVIINVFSKTYVAHRLVWLYLYGEWPTEEIDHIDGDGTNNKLNNLREVSRIENCQNQRLAKNNTSGFLGVRKSGERNKAWRSTIWVNKKAINLGSFKTHLAACYARHQADIKYGFHPNHGTMRAL